jgi:hypothetical protein
MSVINIGPGATNRPDNVSGSYTFLQLTNPANAAGTITTIKVWMSTTGAIKVGMFYQVSGSTYKCRSCVTLGSITAGAERSITTDASGNPISLAAESGDLIGVLVLSGAIDCNVSGAGGHLWASGDKMSVGGSASYSTSSGWAISIAGVGSTGGESVNVSLTDGLVLSDAPSVEIDTSTHPPIDVGPGATDRASTISGANYTDIDLGNPANGTGSLDTVEIWANTALSNCKVGTFYLVSGTTYKCRDSATLGTVTAGSKQTFTGLALEVQTGDYLGNHYTAGTLERDTEGGSGIMYYAGEAIDPGDEADYTLVDGDAISIYASGLASVLELSLSDGLVLSDTLEVTAGIPIELSLSDVLVLSDGPYEPGAKADDFEWGSDGDPITNSGGGITWSKTTNVGDLVEIDTAWSVSGTRALLVHRESSIYCYASCPLTPDDYAYAVQFDVRCEAGMGIDIAHGNGSNRIRFGVKASTGQLFYINVNGKEMYLPTYLSVNTWHRVVVTNISFTTGIYTLLIDSVSQGVLSMWKTGSYVGVVALGSTNGTGSCWFDDVQIIARSDPWVSLSPALDDGLVLSDDPGRTVTIPTAGDPADAVVINGRGYPLLEGSLSVDMAIGSRSTASSVVIDLDAAWDFQEGQQVEIYESFASGDLIFSGYIDRVDTQRIGATQSRAHSIELKDQHYLADKRLAAETYESATAAAIVADLHAKYLADEGVIIGLIEGGDITIREMVINYARVTEALDRLAELCDYVWWIDQHKRLYFVSRTSVPAPWDYVFSQSVAAPSVTEHNSKYRNRQYIKGSAATGTQTETFTGDGETKSWALGYPLNNVPTVTVDGAPASVGIKGLDSGKSFYWSKGDSILTSDVAPAVGVVVSVFYIGQYPAIILSVDSAAVTARAQVEGSTGMVDDVADESGTTDIEALYQIGSAKLTRYCRDARTYRYQTEIPGLFPGQVQHIYDELLGVDQDMLIESVRGTRRGGVWEWEILCTEGPEQGSWTKLFEVLAGQAKLVLDRVNVGLGETMTALVRLDESIGWTDSVKVTVLTVLVCSTSLKCGDTVLVT